MNQSINEEIMIRHFRLPPLGALSEFPDQTTSVCTFAICETEPSSGKLRAVYTVKLLSTEAGHESPEVNEYLLKVYWRQDLCGSIQTSLSLLVISSVSKIF